jgi:hypothetical protein
MPAKKYVAQYERNLAEMAARKAAKPKRKA